MYRKYVTKNGHLHSQLSPSSTVGIILGFVVWIRFDLFNEGKHLAVDRVLEDTLKFAVNVGSQGIKLDTVSHLRNYKFD